MKPRVVNTDNTFKVLYFPCGHYGIMTLKIFTSWGGSQDQLDRIEAGLKFDEPSLHSRACPLCGPYAHVLTPDINGMFANPLYRPFETDE